MLYAASLDVADFRGKVIKLAAVQVEVFQCGQQGFEWGKSAKSAVTQIERFERGESSQRGEITAKMLARVEAEILERGEVC
jgi:hypothetical protein